MNVKITGRHMELSEALKSYIETGLRKVKAHFDRVIDVDVVLDVEKHRHTAEFNLYANGVRINCRETSFGLQHLPATRRPSLSTVQPLR